MIGAEGDQLGVITRDDALEKAICGFGDLPQQTAPGELYTYCNAGIDLVGVCENCG